MPRRRSATQSWEKIGEITGTDNSGTELGKKIFEGKEWDYVFDIDLYGPNAPPVRLPFNRGDDPWMAAQQWLWRYGLLAIQSRRLRRLLYRRGGSASGRSEKGQLAMSCSVKRARPFSFKW